MPGLAATLRERPDRAARFYARFGITETQFRQGVLPSELPDEHDAVAEWLRPYVGDRVRAWASPTADFPEGCPGLVGFN